MVKKWNLNQVNNLLNREKNRCKFGGLDSKHTLVKLYGEGTFSLCGFNIEFIILFIHVNPLHSNFFVPVNWLFVNFATFILLASLVI